MHFGTGPGHSDALTDSDPYILDEHLSEIEICSRVSKSVFFLVSSQLVFHCSLLKAILPLDTLKSKSNEQMCCPSLTTEEGRKQIYEY